MPHYTAFLRAINVGSHTVKMDYLRQLFTEMGFANVDTFIASGNVIFEAPGQDRQALERQIEEYLEETLGYEVATFIRPTAVLKEIAHYQPFPDLMQDGDTLYVAFVAAPLDGEARQQVQSFTTEVDKFHVAGSEIYWLNRKTVGQSNFLGSKLEKGIERPATLRNIRTIVRMAKKYA